ncbi:MAG: prepilin-type N-terminal cleavage/methylation domain-containing protein [Firmicutes bacterium]|nr:prepilin-type N-terminal cleavage/methylation domain-containing protein [Bacillota bacterium]
MTGGRGGSAAGAYAETGFTLIELLVALALSTLVILAAGSSIRQAYVQWSAIRYRLACDRQWAQLAIQLDQDLRSASRYGHPQGVFRPVVSGGRSAAERAFAHSGGSSFLTGDVQGLEVLIWGGPAGLARVTYAFAVAEGVLVRRYDPLADLQEETDGPRAGGWTAAAAGTQQPLDRGRPPDLQSTEEVWVAHLRGTEFAYQDPETGQWEASWPGTPQEPFPAAVRLVLRFVPGPSGGTVTPPPIVIPMAPMVVDAHS